LSGCSNSTADPLADIKPFYLYLLPVDQAHLCPVCAIAEWLDISRIKQGYLFQRIYSGDHIADLDKNTPMVHTFKFPSLPVDCLLMTCRLWSNSWSCSTTTCWMLAWTTTPIKHILSVVEVASTSPHTIDGLSAGSVTGVAGALSFQTSST
jgi:hypothetical protein